MSKKIDWIKVIVIAVAAVLCVFSLIKLFMAYEYYTEKKSESVLSIATPEELQPEPTEGTINTAYVEDQISKAKAAVENAVAIQNENTSKYATDRAMSDEDLNIVRANNEKLLELFGDKAFQDTWVWLGSNYGYLTWQGQTALNYDSVDIIPCVFTLRDNDLMLGAVFADYNTYTEKFENAKKYVTVDGNKYAGYTEEIAPAEEEPLDDDLYDNAKGLADIGGSIETEDGKIYTRTGAIKE